MDVPLAVPNLPSVIVFVEKISTPGADTSIQSP